MRYLHLFQKQCQNSSLHRQSNTQISDFTYLSSLTSSRLLVCSTVCVVLIVEAVVINTLANLRYSIGWNVNWKNKVRSSVYVPCRRWVRSWWRILWCIYYYFLTKIPQHFIHIIQGWSTFTAMKSTYAEVACSHTHGNYSNHTLVQHCCCIVHFIKYTIKYSQNWVWDCV